MTADSQCKSCVAGRYSVSGDGQTSVDVCDNKCSKGKWSDETALTRDTDCKLCVIGMYSDQTSLISANQCKLCSSGKWSSQTGLSSETQCISCVAGRYSTAGEGKTDISVCNNKCSAGKWSDQQARTSDASCTKCNAGRYSLAGEGQTDVVVCTACGAGRYSSAGEGESDASVCTPCAAGRYSTAGEGQSNVAVCDNKCSAGKWSDQTALTSDSECTDCLAGFYSVAGKDQVDISVCTPCVAGRYSNVGAAQIDSSICTPCVAGRYSNDGQGPTDSGEQCLGCPRGYEILEGDKTKCQICGFSKYQDENGKTSVKCKTCDADQFITDDREIAGAHLSASGCITCSEGKFSNSGDRFCESCAAGKERVLTSCVECLAGQFSTSATNFQCQQCSVGFFQTLVGTPYCLPCIPGEFQNSKGAASCKSCPLGWMASQLGAASCTKPQAGAIAAGGATSIPIAKGWHGTNCVDGVCADSEPCPAGTKRSLGTVGCTNCPSGSTSSPGAITCQRCEAGKHSSEAGSPLCVACNVEEHYYSDTTGQAECQLCDTGLVSIGTKCQAAAMDINLPQPSRVAVKLLLSSSLLSSTSSSLMLPPLAVSWTMDDVSGSGSDESLEQLQFDLEISYSSDFPSELTNRTQSFVCPSKLCKIRNKTTISATTTTAAASVMEEEVTVNLSLQDQAPLWQRLVYAKVRTSRAILYKSQWSGTSVGWITAEDCTDSEYLDTSHFPSNPVLWKCLPCPLGASCFGFIQNNGIKPKVGWSRCYSSYIDKNLTALKFDQCTFAASCLGGRNLALVGKFANLDVTADHNESCYSPGYRNNSRLCGQCASGYSLRDQTGQCFKCPTNDNNKIFAVLGSLAGIVSMIIYAKITINERGELKAADGAKAIGMSFVQTVGLLTTFPIAWPAIFVNIFAVGGAITEVGQHFVDMKCLIDSTSEEETTEAWVFYMQQVGWALGPLALILLNTSFWQVLVRFFCRQNDDEKENNDEKESKHRSSFEIFKVPEKELGSRTAVTSVAFLYLFWPVLTKRTFEMFACRTVCDDTHSYFLADLNEQCWVGRHAAWTFALGLPMLIGYVVMLPAVAWWRIHRLHTVALLRKIKPYELPEHKHWGMLYSCFAPEIWFWEVTVAARKISVAFIGVFGVGMGEIQVHLMALIIAFIILTTAVVRPYGDQKLLHFLELLGLSALFLTLWAGTVFNSYPKCEDHGGLTLAWCSVLSLVVGVVNCLVLVCVVFIFVKNKCCSKEEIRSTIDTATTWMESPMHPTQIGSEETTTQIGSEETSTRRRAHDDIWRGVARGGDESSNDRSHVPAMGVTMEVELGNVNGHKKELEKQEEKQEKKKTKKKREYPRQRKKKKVEEENQDGDQHHTPTVIEVKSMSDGVAVAFSPAISKTERKTTGMKRLQDDGKDQVDAAQTRAHHTHTISKLQSSTEEHF